MVEEKDVLNELEQNQIKENTAKILGNIRYEPAVPIQLTITGEGDKGMQEIELFLSTLNKLREIRELGEVNKVLNHKNPVVEVEILRKTGYYNPKTLKPDTQKYEVPKGMILKILNKGEGGVEMRLSEDLSGGKTSVIRELINVLGIWTDFRELSDDYLRDCNGGIGSKKVLRINKIKPVTDLEEKLLAEIKLYQNMQKSLFKTMKKVERKIKLNPKELLDDIQFYTNLWDVDIEKLEKRTKLAYFLREIHGIMKAENNVTIEIVKSNLKSMEIAANRRALMFLCRNKFPWLSSSNIARVFSKYGEPPKNHVTVLVACKKFNTEVSGIEIENYPNEKYSAKDLLYDAENRHLAYLKKTNREKYRNSTIEDIFVLKLK